VNFSTYNAIRGFPHGLAFALALGSRCSPLAPNAALVGTLVGEVTLEKFFDGPVAHIALQEGILLLGLKK
jgi:hypothetical protein